MQECGLAQGGDHPGLGVVREIRDPYPVLPEAPTLPLEGQPRRRTRSLLAVVVVVADGVRGGGGLRGGRGRRLFAVRDSRRVWITPHQTRARACKRRKKRTALF